MISVVLPRYFTKESPLALEGLLGPVRLLADWKMTCL